MLGKECFRFVALHVLLHVFHVLGPSVNRRNDCLTLACPLQIHGIAATPFPGIVQVEDGIHVTLVQLHHQVVQPGEDGIVVHTRFFLEGRLHFGRHTVAAVCSHQDAEIVHTDTFQVIQFLVQAFPVSAFPFRGEDGAIPEVGTHIIVRFSVADELSVFDADKIRSGCRLLLRLASE